MMFSATFPKTARALAKEFMAHDHVRVRVGRAGSTHLSELLTQTVRTTYTSYEPYLQYRR